MTGEKKNRTHYVGPFILSLYIYPIIKHVINFIYCPLWNGSITCHSTPLCFYIATGRESQRGYFVHRIAKIRVDNIGVVHWLPGDDKPELLVKRTSQGGPQEAGGLLTLPCKS